LTSRRFQSVDSIHGEGHISKCGDGEVRTALYEVASAMLVRSKKWCTLKAWSIKIATKRGRNRAVVAVARKLSIIIQRMGMDGSAFRFSTNNFTEEEQQERPRTRLANA